MKTEEVNDLVINAVRSNASPQVAGFLYQFIVALDYCFQLNPGQSLYIERYGDVAIKADGSFEEKPQDICVEVKLYSSDLNVGHHNFLNTLYNWLDDNFGFESYQNLIIYTTQSFSTNSALVGWNQKTPDQRLEVVINAYEKYLKDNKDKLAEKDRGQHPTINKNARMINKVLGSVKGANGQTDVDASRFKLKELLSRVSIIDSCKGLASTYNGLFKYAKAIEERLRGAFINSLLGYIICPGNMNNGWVVKEAAFSEQVCSLTTEMAPLSISFPAAPDVMVVASEYEDALFVKKLKDIDYNRIAEAVGYFAKTTKLLTRDFDRPWVEKNLADYQAEIIQLYQLKYDNSVDSLFDGKLLTDEEIKRSSRVFLRDLLQQTKSISLAPFGGTKYYFSEGMCHYVANNKKDNVIWLLKKDE